MEKITIRIEHDEGYVIESQYHVDVMNFDHGMIEFIVDSLVLQGYDRFSILESLQEYALNES